MNRTVHHDLCVFRLAAGPRTGYGHLMRAHALARCLGMRTAISLRGGHAARQAAARLGYALVDGRAALRGAALLIVDDPSPAHGANWVKRAQRSGIRTVSIHDADDCHHVDLAVCGSLGAAPAVAGPALVGSRFYLLNGAVARARRIRPGAAPLRRRPRVLIALGGGHHVRTAARPLVAAVRARCPHADIIVAAGFSGGRRPALAGARWLQARRGLAPALASVNLAVVAGGVTLYEACAIGVPAVAVAVVPAQRRAIAAFARRQAVVDAGGAPDLAAAIETAAAAVSRLLTDRRARQALARRARRLVDGRGAERVAAAIARTMRPGGVRRG